MMIKPKINFPVSNFESTFKQTIKVYLFALSLIILFIVSSFILEKYLLTSQKEHANIINLSGRQRMLSQRIAVYVGRAWGLETLEKNEENNRKIKENLLELRNILNALTYRSSLNDLTELNSQSTQDLMTESANSLKSFFDNIRQFSENHDMLVSKNSVLQKQAEYIQDLALGPILNLFDQLTKEREKNAFETIKKFEMVKFVLLLISLVLIVCEAVFIFYPLAKSNLDKSTQILNQYNEREKLKKFSSLGEVFAKIVHEINNPLMIALLKIGVVKKNSELDDNTLHSLESVHKNLLRIVKIIKSTKLIYRTGKNDQASLVSLNQVIEDAVDAATIIKHEPNLNIEINSEKEIVIKIEEHQIFQVIMNLIINAIEASSDEDIKKVRLEVVSRENGLSIIISDNGPGVPASIENFIFEQLFTTKSQGTGMGLFECRKIIESYEGSLKLNREYSDSSFEIFFPESMIEKIS